MNHIIVFLVLLILIVISILYYYSYNNNIKNHIKEKFEDIQPENFSRLLLTNSNVRTVVYDRIHNCSYYAGLDDKITKVDFNNFTETQTILLTKVSNIKSSFINKNSSYVYFITETKPSIIIRIDLSNFTNSGVKYGILPPTYHKINFSITDSSTKFGYFLSISSFSGSYKYILKVDLEEFKYVDNLDTVIYYTNQIDNLDANDFTYYNIENNINIKVGLLYIPINSLITPSSLMIDKFEKDIYIGTDKGIIKYDLTNPNAFITLPVNTEIFKVVNTDTFNKNNPSKLYSSQPIISSIIDNDNKYGFFVTNESKLLKIELTAFADDTVFLIKEINNPLVTKISLPTTIETKNLIIDNDNKYLYGDSNNGKIFRLDIASASNEIKDLNLPEKKANMNGGMIIDKENMFLYIVGTEISSYVFKIKLKDYISSPTEEVQTNELETINENLFKYAEIKPKSNIKIDEINAIQKNIDTILENKSIENIIPNLNEIDTKMNTVLEQQSKDHKEIIDLMNLTIKELTNTKNIIDQERANANLTGEEPYLIKTNALPVNIKETFTCNEPMAFDPLNSIHDIKDLENNTQRKQIKINKHVFSEHKVHPRINDFINLEPDWKIEWSKSIQNANINQLLVLP